jgi:Domain of unknown function (DUF1772)
MLLLLQVVTVFLASSTFALSFAHAVELPGKLRLDKQGYCAVQTIYYPGFTFGGIAELLAIAAALGLLLVTPAGSIAFILTLIALVGLIANHLAYWLLTHPVNNFWLKDQDLSGLGGRFFNFGRSARESRGDLDDDEIWLRFRDRWEFSHVLRAAFSAVSLIALITAVAIR